MLDITMTAVRRPEILYKTLYSFAKVFNYYKDCRLIINIDPVGGNKLDEEKVINLCNSFFTNIVINIPKEPSFIKAFKWCWSKIETPIIFHLEDDWELLKTFDLKNLIYLLNSDPDLALLRLSAFRSEVYKMKNWNKFFPWHKTFFKCPKDLRGSVGFCGHPSFIKKDFINKCLPLMNSISNPEKQFHQRGSKLLIEVLNWNYGVFIKQNSIPIIKDIGRHWIVNTNWRKKGNKAHFDKWEQIVI